MSTSDITGNITGATAAGRGALDYAAEFMPALRAATAAVAAGDRLRGVRVGVSLVLEPKTACLIEALATLGADVAVLGSSNSTKMAVVEALRADGIAVFAEAGSTPQRYAELRDQFIDTKPQLLADDGAAIARRMHSERRDALEFLEGISEETTSGVRPLRNMADAGELAVPCVAVNDARTKLLFDNVYGTGQSVVMSTLDATNMQMQGKVVVVVGYGRVGRGIAKTARALGARVTVTEIDPVEALAAHHDGHRVAQLAEAVRDADFVITASGIGHSLTGDHVAAMRDGTVIAVGGAGPPEFDPSMGADVGWGEFVRPHVRELVTANGASVYLIADGFCANTTAGEGNPIEVMDLSLALQLRALDYLAANDLDVGVHVLPAEIDDEVAASALRAAGLDIDVPSPAQRDAARSW